MALSTRSAKSSFTAVALYIQGGKVLMLHKPKIKYGVTFIRHVFPGGTVDFGEHPIDGAWREGQEEVGLDGKDGRLLGYKIKKNGRTFFYVLFDRFEGEARNAEPDKHRGIEWVDLRTHRPFKGMPMEVAEALRKYVVSKPF